MAYEDYNSTPEAHFALFNTKIFILDYHKFQVFSLSLVLYKPKSLTLAILKLWKTPHHTNLRNQTEFRPLV